MRRCVIAHLDITIGPELRHTQLLEPLAIEIHRRAPLDAVGRLQRDPQLIVLELAALGRLQWLPAPLEAERAALRRELLHHHRLELIEPLEELLRRAAELAVLTTRI